MTKEEFGKLIEEQGKEVYSFCYYLTGKKEDAEELYQDTMLKAMEKCYKIEKSKNPKSLLVSIAIGIYKNNQKKWKNRQRIMPISEDGNEITESYKETKEYQPEREILKKELYTFIYAEINALPEKFRLVIYMFYTVELSIEEIAKLLHIPRGTVKSRLYKARIRLKTRLEEEGYERTGI